jgi:hypothetical protein
VAISQGIDPGMNERYVFAAGGSSYWIYQLTAVFIKKITVYKVKEEYGLALVQCPV